MNYLSVCSGIEAATVAWHPLGWQPIGFSEIEKFPSRVLAHHYPNVRNYGDITNHKRWDVEPFRLLVGGTPCQSFSVAGLRKGMADPRGNLALTYLAIADRYRPEWLVWENVPGVLSSNGGRDFGAFLGGLVELGYGFAYRVLDAQYVRVDGYGRAVPQRRRRVFVVGNSRSWRRAAAVLFERESLSWNSAPRREAGEGVAARVDVGVGGGSERVSSTGSVAHCLNAGAMGRLDYETETMIAHPYTLAIRGRDGQPDLEYRQDGTANAILTPNGGRAGIGVGAVAFTQNQRDEVREMDVAGALAAEPGMKQQTYVNQGWAVRRLTPTECERLQGFPDGYTNIGKAADGPRYKALGNSMACNVMRWVGRRIQMVDDLVANLTP